MATPKWKVAEYKRVNEIIIAAKSKPCADCGQIYPWYVMDFDHVRGVKEFTIGANRYKGSKRIQKEIEKCDVVCSNCHRIRTFTSRQLFNMDKDGNR